MILIFNLWMTLYFITSTIDTLSTMIIWLSMDTFIRLSLPFFDDYKKRFIDNITGAKERINSSSSLGNTTKSQMIDRLDKFGKHPYVLTTSYYHLYWTAFRISVQMYLEFYFYFWSSQYFDYLLTFIPRLLSVLYLTHLFYQRISKRV